MSKDIKESLARIGEHTARLNQLCDEGAATIRDLEDTLEKMNVGVPAFVHLRSYQLNDEHPYEALVYARIGERFRIGYEHGDCGDPESASSKPWSDCSREIKIDTLSKVPELIAEIANEVEKRANEAQKAIATVKKLTSSSKKDGS